MAHRPVCVKVVSVVAGDASRFLPAVLQGVEPKSNHGGSTFGVSHAKNAALLPKFIVVKWVGGQHFFESRCASLAGI